MKKPCFILHNCFRCGHSIRNILCSKCFKNYSFRWCEQEFIDLFYELKAYLDGKIGNYKICYKYDYCAYTSDQMFEEVRLHEKEVLSKR